VVGYRGERVHSIRHALRTGAEAAKLTYGRDIGGVTFHTIRHTAATLLAEMPSVTACHLITDVGTRPA
jgi:integrase